MTAPCDLCDEPAVALQDEPSAVLVDADGTERCFRMCGPCRGAWRRQHARLIGDGWRHVRPPPRARPDLAEAPDDDVGASVPPPLLTASLAGAAPAPSIHIDKVEINGVKDAESILPRFRAMLVDVLAAGGSPAPVTT